MAGAAATLISFTFARLDAWALLALLVTAWVWSGRRLRRQGLPAGHPPGILAGAVLLGLLGIAAAESLPLLVSGPTPEEWQRLAIARCLVLLFTFAAGLIGLAVLRRFARLRGELDRRMHAERQLQTAKDEAEEANRAKGDFLAVMSHEIRTPLNAVMGFGNLLVETRLDETQRGYVGTILSESQRLKSLISDVLDLTKLEQGRVALERVAFAPAEATHDVLRLFSARAAERSVDLRFEAQIDSRLQVMGDPLRFRQVLVNLVDNALKFTPAGAVSLFLSWVPDDVDSGRGRLRLRVCDTGIGIPADKLARLFQMFTQADSSMTRRFGGTGLGLAICERIVSLMGGEITVQSKPGVGSEFTVSLPLTAAADPVGAIAPAAADPATPSAPPRILIVDDMETNRFLLEVYLRRHGFEPELASGGAEAIRLAQEKHYDAILMDLQMPEVDGFTATQRIRAAETPEHRTPIIALTASIGRTTRERCLAAGMNEYLTKPLDLAKFKALLQKFIRPSLGRAA